MGRSRFLGEVTHLFCALLGFWPVAQCGAQTGGASGGCIPTTVEAKIPGLTVPYLSACLNGTYTLKFADGMLSHTAIITIQSPTGATIALTGNVNGKTNTLTIGQHVGLASTCPGLGVYMRSTALPPAPISGALYLATQQGEQLIKSAPLTGDENRSALATCLGSDEQYEAYLSGAQTSLAGQVFVQAFLTPTVCAGVTFDTEPNAPIILNPGIASFIKPSFYPPPTPPLPPVNLGPSGSFTGRGFALTRPTGPPLIPGQTLTPSQPFTPVQPLNPTVRPFNPPGRLLTPPSQPVLPLVPTSNPPGQTQTLPGGSIPNPPVNQGPYYSTPGTFDPSTGLLTPVANSGLSPANPGLSDASIPGSSQSQGPPNRDAKESKKWVAIVVPMLVICVLTSVLGGLAFFFGLRNIRKVVIDQMGELRRVLTGHSRSPSYQHFATEANQGRVRSNPVYNNSDFDPGFPNRGPPGIDVRGPNWDRAPWQGTENGLGRNQAGMVGNPPGVAQNRAGLGPNPTGFNGPRRGPIPGGPFPSRLDRQPRRPARDLRGLSESSEEGPEGHVAPPRSGGFRIGLWPNRSGQGRTRERGPDLEEGEGGSSQPKTAKIFSPAEDGLSRLFNWARSKPPNPETSKPPDLREPLTIGHVFVPSNPSWERALRREPLARETNLPDPKASSAGLVAAAAAAPPTRARALEDRSSLEEQATSKHHGGGAIGGASLSPLQREQPTYLDAPSNEGLESMRRKGTKAFWSKSRVPLAKADSLNEKDGLRTDMWDGRISETESEEELGESEGGGLIRGLEPQGGPLIGRGLEKGVENPPPKLGRRKSTDSNSLGSTVTKRVSDVGKNLGTNWELQEHVKSAALSSKDWAAAEKGEARLKPGLGAEKEGLGPRGAGLGTVLGGDLVEGSSIKRGGFDRGNASLGRAGLGEGLDMGGKGLGIRDLDLGADLEGGLGFGREGMDLLNRALGEASGEGLEEGLGAGLLGQEKGFGNNLEAAGGNGRGAARGVKDGGQNQSLGEERLEADVRMTHFERNVGLDPPLNSAVVFGEREAYLAGAERRAFVPLPADRSGGIRFGSSVPTRVDPLEKVREWFERGDHAGGALGAGVAAEREGNGREERKVLAERAQSMRTEEPNGDMEMRRERSVVNGEKGAINRVEGFLAGRARTESTGGIPLGSEQPGSYWETESLLFGKRPPRWDASRHKKAHVTQTSESRSLTSARPGEGAPNNRVSSPFPEAVLTGPAAGPQNTRALARTRRSSDATRARERAEEELGEFFPDRAEMEMVESLLFELPEMVASVKHLRSELESECGPYSSA